MKKKLSIYTQEHLAALIGVDSPFKASEEWEFGDTYCWALNDALASGKTQEEAEEAALEAEGAESDRHFRAYERAFLDAARELFELHDLELIEERTKKGGTVYRAKPKKSWRAVCKALVETINGYGLFGFKDVDDLCRSGPYTPKEAALGHVHWIATYPKIYGGDSDPGAKIERAMRYVY